MLEDPTVTGLRALRMEVALGKAISLSSQQAREIWRAMQLIATKGSVEGLAENLIQTATEFNRYPPAWKIVAVKALNARHRCVTKYPTERALSLAVFSTVEAARALQDRR